MVRRLGLGKNNYLTYASLALNPRCVIGDEKGRKSRDSLVSNGLQVSILYKSTASRYRPVRVADGPKTACYRFIKTAG